MAFSLPNADMCALLILGLGAPALGLVRWANRSLLSVGVALLFVGAASATLLGSGSAKVWLPLAVLAVVHPAAVAAGHYRDTLLRLLASRRSAALLLLAAGPLLAGVWAKWIDYSSSAPSADLGARRQNSVPMPNPVPLAMTAYTDRGQAVPLSTRPVDELSAATVKQAERLMTAGHPEAQIRTDGPDPSYNCHGWVFADGHYWIRNEAVESILTDNDYSPVAKPRAGDVIVYRSADGRVGHTGLVRLVDKDSIIVESKWGHVGRFLHPASEQPYGETWAFYRSTRRGHLVRIGDSPSSNDGVGE